MKKILTTSLIVFLSACAAAPQQKTTTDKNNLASEVIGEFLLERVEANGERVLCDQPAYVDCFQLTVEQCLAETAPFKAKCINGAKEKVGNLSSENAKSFGSVFGMCMGLNHLLLHSADAKEIGACLKTAKFDKDATANSLFRK